MVIELLKGKELNYRRRNENKKIREKGEQADETKKQYKKVKMETAKLGQCLMLEDGARIAMRRGDTRR